MEGSPGTCCATCDLYYVVKELTAFTITSVHVLISKEYHEGKQKVLELDFKNVIFKAFCTFWESACREGKSDSGNTHHTSDSVCEHGDCLLVQKCGDSDSVCEHGDSALVRKGGDSDSVCEHHGSGGSCKHVMFVMSVPQNTLGHSVKCTAVPLNPKGPVHNKVTCKHEVHNSTQQKVCVEGDAGSCMETSSWPLEEKLILEKKVREMEVEPEHGLLELNACHMLLRKRIVAAVGVFWVFFHSGVGMNNSEKVVKEEEMDRSQFRNQSLHTVQDEPQVDEQFCRFSNWPQTFDPASEKRHDCDERSLPESIACTSNLACDLYTRTHYTETRTADYLTCSVLEDTPTVPSPERSPSPQKNERGPCLLSSPEEGRAMRTRYEDALVNTVFQTDLNLPCCQGTDEPTSLSKKSMEFDTAYELFLITNSWCDNHETEKPTAFIRRKEEEQQSREKMKVSLKTEDGSTEKRTAFKKTEQKEEKELRLMSRPFPYPQGEKEETDDKESQDGQIENADNAIDRYAWMWQGPNMFPRSRDMVVAMLHGAPSSPSRMDLHHSAGMENEWNRLRSFSLFTPPGGVFVLRLASAGFFLLTGGEGKAPEEASVKCAFCEVGVRVVEFVVKAAMEVHRERSPGCRFVLGEEVGNVSATQITERSSVEFLHGLDSAYPSFGKSPQASSSSRTAARMAAPGVGGGLQRGKADLAMDCCPDPTTTADRAPLALDPKGHHSSPAGGGAGNGNTLDWKTPLLPSLVPSPEQAARPAVVAHCAVASPPSAAAAASSAASQRQESRLPAAASEAFVPQTAGTNTPPPPPPPPQSATVQPPPTPQTDTNATHQPAGNASSSFASSSSSSSSPPVNHPPAASSINNSSSSSSSNLARAGEVRMDGASGGTARHEPLPAPESQSGGNVVGSGSVSGGGGGVGRGGSGDRTVGEDGRPQDRQLVTYDELGIFTQQPKRPDMVVKSVRVNTFERWPHTDSHPADEMAEAGFYYTGHEDLVRCFHCKGGLKTWERSDKPWVEHSRWFPRCPFVRLAKGPKFVDAVQKLNNPQTRPAISEEDVEREIRRMEDEERLGLTPNVTLLSTMEPPSPDSDPTWGPLARAALRIDADVTEASMSDMAERLEDENEEMRDSIRCKMCQMNNVNVLFLPCGHLVACTQCAPALRRCAMCRAAVKGSVHVYMDDTHGNRDGNSGSGSQGTTTS